MDIMKLSFSSREIMEKRRAVRSEYLQQTTGSREGNVEEMSARDLKLLYTLYDRIFFRGSLAAAMRYPLVFSLSRRMTKAAGKTIMRYKPGKMAAEIQDLEIRIGVDFFFQYNAVNREKSVGGLSTNDALDALQLVFEHEICHLVEYNLFGKSSCRQEQFKKLAFNLFGHNTSYHHLPTPQEILHQQYGYKPGNHVSFIREGRRFSGIITRIQKRATVMVPDVKGDFMDSNKKRYSKYYVPLELLE